MVTFGPILISPTVQLKSTVASFGATFGKVLCLLSA